MPDSPAPPRLPLLPPPPPQFPTRFSSAETQPEQLEAQAEWPEPADEGGSIGVPECEWGLRTEAEQHVDRLEARLAKLREDVVPSHPLPAILPDDLEDIDENAEADEVTGEPEGVAAGDEADEGRALLSAVGSPSGHGEASQQAHGFSDDDEGVALAAPVVEGPDSGTDLQHPSLLHRISFGNTVRISGGIRSSSRPHRHRHADAFVPPAPTERTSLLSAQPRPISAPSDLLVAAVTPSAGPSRSTSPASRSRRASLSSSHRSITSFAHLHPSSYPASSSPTSYGASRSSSPCSSIYAPLQPPSKYCPNPLWVRTAAQRGLRRSRSGSSLSFQDFLRSGAAYAPYDDEDDEDDSDEAEVVADATVATDDDPRGRRFGPSRAEYRDLVEAQKARRARWEARRAAKEAHSRAAANEANARSGSRFWDRVAGLLALGMVGAGPTRAGGLGGSTARNGVGVGGYGAGAGRGRGRSPARPSPLGRGSSHTPSLLSVESGARSLSSSDGEGEGAEGPQRVPPPRRARAGRPGRTPVVKTETDVRFGPAPWRYFRLDWLRYKIVQLLAAARAALRTAMVGLERECGRQRERTGYDEV